MNPAPDHLRDMSTSCPRCGQAAGVACRKVTRTSADLTFVFPCSTNLEEAKSVIEEAKRRILAGEM